MLNGTMHTVYFLYICAQKAFHSTYMRIHSVKIISIILLILFFLFNVKYSEYNHNISQFC